MEIGGCQRKNGNKRNESITQERKKIQRSTDMVACEIITFEQADLLVPESVL